MRFLRERNSTQRSIMAAIGNAAAEMRENDRKSLANMIAEILSKALS